MRYEGEETRGDEGLMFECLNVRMFECLDWKQLEKTTFKRCAG